MLNRPATKELQDFYLEQLCPKCDELLRFCFALCLSLQDARNLTAHTFSIALEKLPEIMKSQHPMLALLGIAWDNLKSEPERQDDMLPPIISTLLALKREERLAVMLIDIMGLREKECCSLTGWNAETVIKHAGAGRQKILAV